MRARRVLSGEAFEKEAWGRLGGSGAQEFMENTGASETGAFTLEAEG